MAEEPLLELDQGTLLVVTEEIKHKSKGYVVVKSYGTPQDIPVLLEEGVTRLKDAGAKEIFAACSVPENPLMEEYCQAGRYQLKFEGSMLEMQRELVQNYSKEQGMLALTPLGRENAQTFLALYNDTFFEVPNSATYQQEELTRLLDTTKTLCFLVNCQGEDVGIAELDLQPEIPEIASVGIVPGKRGNGLGASLMHSLMAVLAQRGYTKVFLRVHEANSTALALYQRLGFEVVKIITRWYRLQ